MRFLKYLLPVLFVLAPLGAFAATAVPWTLTNVTDLFITPTAVNGHQVGITVNGTSTLATTTTSVINGTIVVDGIHYARNTNGIQAAMNACSNQGGGIVYLPPAAYTISDVVMRSNCLLTGAGTSTVINITGFFGIKFDTISNAGVSYVHLDGTAQSLQGAFAKEIEVANSSDILIDHVLGTNAYAFGTFVEASKNATTTRVTITNNHFEGLGNNDVYGGGPADDTGIVSDVIFTNNYGIQNFGGVGTYPNVFDMVGGNDYKVNNNILVGGVLFGFEVSPHQAVEFINNQFKPDPIQTQTLIFIQSSSTPSVSDNSVIVSGNIVDAGSIFIVGANGARTLNVNVSNNVIKRCATGQSCLSLNFVQGFVVDGNVFNGITSGAPGTGFSGIKYSNSIEGVISNNYLVNNDVCIFDATGVPSITLIGNKCDVFNTQYVGVVGPTLQSSNSTPFWSMGTSTAYSALSVWGNSTTLGRAFEVTNSASTSLLFIPNSTTATSTFGTGLQANVLNLISTTASSTFANGVNLSNGCFAVSGVCLSSNALTSDPNWILTGSPSYLTPTSTQSIGVFGSSTIGNGTQAGGLTVSGGATTTQDAYFQKGLNINFNSGTNGLNQLTIGNGLTGNKWSIGRDNASTGNLIFYNNGSEAIRFTGSNVSITGGSSIGSAFASIAAPTNGLIVQGTTGIGTSSPFAKLSIHANNGDTNLNLFAIGSSTQTATSTLFVVNNIGNVGIGTGAPGAQLEIFKNTAGALGPELRLNNPADTGSGDKFAVSAYDGGSGSPFRGGLLWTLNGVGQAQLEIKGGSGQTTLAAVNTIATFLPGGNVGIGVSSPTYKLDVSGLGHFTGLVDALSFTATSTTATSSFAGGFQAGAGNGFQVNANNGYVNIGNQTASYPAIFPLQNFTNFDAYGTNGANLNTQSSYNMVIGTQIGTNGSGVGLAFGDSVTNGTIGASILHIRQGSNDFGDLSFNTRVNGGNITEKMRITSSGTVGVGTSSPYAQLTVATPNNSTGSILNLFLIASSTSTGTTTPFSISNTGWMVTSGTKPTAGTCGSTQVINGNMMQGDISFTGTLVTSCQVNFPVPVPAGTTLHCTATDNSLTGFADISATTTSSVTFGISAGLAAATITWQCGATRDANN